MRYEDYNLKKRKLNTCFYNHEGEGKLVGLEYFTTVEWEERRTYESSKLQIREEYNQR